MSYDEIIDMLPEFVLGTLEPAEMLAVDAAVAADPRLARELLLVEEAMAAMAMIKAATPPPPQVREKLMARVAPPKVAVKPVATASVKSISQTTAPRQSWWQRLFGQSNGGWQLATGLVMIALAISLVSLNGLRGTVTQLEGQVGVLTADLAESQSQIDTLQISNEQLQQELDQERNALQLASNPERFLALTDTGIAGQQISGTFFQRDDEVLLVANNLPPAPTGKAYYLWGVVIDEEGTKIFNNLGLVPLDENGDTVFVVDNVEIAEGFEEFMVIDVSLEDETVPRPPVLEGDILLRGGSVP